MIDLFNLVQGVEVGVLPVSIHESTTHVSLEVTVQPLAGCIGVP